MNAFHSATDVPRTLVGDEVVEQREGFSFGAGGVEEWGGEDVHALYVESGSLVCGVGEEVRGGG